MDAVDLIEEEGAIASYGSSPPVPVAPYTPLPMYGRRHERVSR